MSLFGNKNENLGQPTRKLRALQTRFTAALLASDGPDPEHASNGDEYNLINPSTKNSSFIASFTKGLPHDHTTGLLAKGKDYELFVRAIESGRQVDIRQIPLGPVQGRQPHPKTSPTFSSALANNPPANIRAWESMAAGHAFDLEGPDAQAVTMPPAPDFRSAELSFEVTELYWMALLRDTSFSQFERSELVQNAISSLNSHPWVQKAGATNSSASALSRARKHFTTKTVFRGTLPGDDVGPYISQFLIAGTSGLGDGNSATEGFVQYGSIRIDQRVRTAMPARDYLTSWGSWCDVQDGADVRGREEYVSKSHGSAFRFITTPRDLATYVHYDALYEAYLNACLILLGIGAPFDEGIPFTQPDFIDKQAGFATFGGPHILSLVTEVATRALKAVRFQKFNIHRRARPEVMAARIDAYRRGGRDVRNQLADTQNLLSTVDGEVLRRIFKENGDKNRCATDSGRSRHMDADPFTSSKRSDEGTYLLPMAYAEGSPMHPAYGAGHATVAGACVTVLKAFFNTKFPLPFAFETSEDGSCLVPVKTKGTLTVGGELNKVCSNISIGRNWAGVHYYSDYIESIRMGEDIAIGILKEQTLTFAENYSMTLPRFDGTELTISKGNGASLKHQKFSSPKLI